jgi:hypothetical protein
VIAHNALMSPRTKHPYDARRLRARLGLAAFTCTIALATLGCGAAEDTAAPPSPKVSTGATTDAATTASVATAPDLQGVAMDVRRDPG